MSRLLSDLRPEIRPMADKFLDAAAAAGIDLLVTATLRTFAEQRTLYEQGRSSPGPIVTRATPENSPHCFGLAIDVVPIINSKPDWVGTDPVWQVVGELGQQAGLRWLGAADSPYIDLPHFEHPQWRLIAQQMTT
jgi:peptidoglycan L-alanyl-D-glutamate endopeptidase CwlK